MQEDISQQDYNHVQPHLLLLQDYRPLQVQDLLELDKNRLLQVHTYFLPRQTPRRRLFTLQAYIHLVGLMRHSMLAIVWAMNS